MIQGYDKKDYTIWNSKEGDIADVRGIIRAHYLPAQRYLCAYCRQFFPQGHGMAWTIDHILPKKRYPQFLLEPQNLAMSCWDCNKPKDEHDSYKGKLPKNGCYPHDGTHFDIIHPHFDDYEKYIELTKIGDSYQYKLLGDRKGSQTYLVCDLKRFDFKYAGAGISKTADSIWMLFSNMLDALPPDATVEEIKRFGQRMIASSIAINTRFETRTT